MTERPVAAWHFVHPDLGGRDDRGHGPGPVVDASGRVAVVHGDEAVRQALLMLLSTRPGERVMRPEYGCPLHRLMFQPLDHTTAGMAIHYVERSVRRWERRVDVLRVDAYPSPNIDGALTIELHYRCRSTRRADSVVVDVSVESAGAIA